VWKQFQDESAAGKTSNLLISLLHRDNTDAHEDHLICTKTAMRHFSKASVYNSGNRQWALRARAMYMHGVDRAG
jgi:hypothetical protein